MKFKKLFSLLFILSASTVFAQKDGYWDKERAFKKEVVVSAGSRIIIKTEELPIGTTEVVFRITLLDENQQMASSLVSVLKSIPDPSGISQGSAGAVLLLSKISGSDKCNYALFSNENLATDYQKSGNTLKACLKQEEAISEDARRISVDNSLCLSANTKTMWFGFESKNWVMSQKIILEVVPWVNIRLSRGWTVENRKFVIDQCKTSDLAKKMNNSDDFCVCLLNKMQKEYKFQEFEKLLAIEQSKAYKDFGNDCYAETKTSNASDSELRSQASSAAKIGKYDVVIDKLGAIVENGKATAMDYNNLGYTYLLTKQYEKAIKFLKEGEKKDRSELLIQLNLAHAYLLNDDFKTAKPIYTRYKSQNVTANVGWIQKVKLDFETFERLGLPSGDFNKILKLLKN